jgi:hypothetical protein
LYSSIIGNSVKSVANGVRVRVQLPERARCTSQPHRDRVNSSAFIVAALSMKCVTISHRLGSKKMTSALTPLRPQIVLPLLRRRG